MATWGNTLGALCPLVRRVGDENVAASGPKTYLNSVHLTHQNRHLASDPEFLKALFFIKVLPSGVAEFVQLQSTLQYRNHFLYRHQLFESSSINSFKSFQSVDEGLFNDSCVAPVQNFSFDRSSLNFSLYHADLYFFNSCNDSFYVNHTKSKVTCASNATHGTFVVLAPGDEGLNCCAECRRSGGQCGFEEVIVYVSARMDLISGTAMTSIIDRQNRRVIQDPEICLLLSSSPALDFLVHPSPTSPTKTSRGENPAQALKTHYGLADRSAFG
ncbi:hypothetical protein WN944_011638 [Citrus x changshan-huyou]|uniref:Uncharacterized protein n=1 Tax=Citrus x changshan-huyou TaxID=2935761 RepID=A0AAP0QYY6_9ROSI